jgi:hypothetical protein
MDLLSSRYANPYFFIDGMIQTGRFEEFVMNFVDTINQEQKDKTLWDVYIHRITDMTYSEFLEKIEIEEQNQNMTEKTIETTVQESLNILQNFNPKEYQGGE